LVQRVYEAGSPIAKAYNACRLKIAILSVTCMAVATWKPHPLGLNIVEILEKKGAMTDEELFDMLKETQEQLGFGTVNQMLMKLEVQGKIYVSSLTKGKRRVELMKRKEQ
jgi:Fe2+ or Zn2+ uptake regulation protein